MNMFVVLSLVSAIIFNFDPVFAQENGDGGLLQNYQLSGTFLLEPTTEAPQAVLLLPAQTVMDPVYVVPENGTALAGQQQQPQQPQQHHQQQLQQQAPGFPYFFGQQPQQTPIPAAPFMGYHYPQFYPIVNQHQQQQQAAPIVPPYYPMSYNFGALNKPVPATPVPGYYPQFVPTAPASSGNPQPLFYARPIVPGMSKLYPTAADAPVSPCQLMRQNPFVYAGRR